MYVVITRYQVVRVRFTYDINEIIALLKRCIGALFKILSFSMKYEKNDTNGRVLFLLLFNPLGLYPGPLGDLYATQPFWFICFHVNHLLQKPCNSNTLKQSLATSLEMSLGRTDICDGS